jgi:hypothetical protein
MAMRIRHKKIIDEYMIEKKESMGANQLIHNLWDYWGSDSPTRREIGIYLRNNPNYIKISNGLYYWDSER